MDEQEKVKQWLDDLVDCQEKAQKLKHSDIHYQYERNGEIRDEEVMALIDTTAAIRQKDGNIDFVKAIQITDVPKIAKILGISYETSPRDGDLEFPTNYMFEYKDWRIFSITTYIEV